MTGNVWVGCEPRQPSLHDQTPKTSLDQIKHTGARVPAKPVLSEETHTFHHSEGRVGQKALLSGRWRPPIYWQWQPNPPFVHELGKNLTVRVPPLVRESTLHGT